MSYIEFPTTRRDGVYGLDSASDDDRDSDSANVDKFGYRKISWSVQIDALPVEILGEVFACFYDIILPFAFDEYADDDEDGLPFDETEAQMAQRIFRKRLALQTLLMRVCQRWRLVFLGAGSCVWHRQCIYAPPARHKMTSSAKDAYWTFIEASISHAPKANVHVFALMCDSHPEDEARLAKNLARVLPYASKAHFTFILSPSLSTLLDTFRGEIKQPLPGITSIAMDGRSPRQASFDTDMHFDEFTSSFFDFLPNMDTLLRGDALARTHPRKDHLRGLRTLRITELPAPMLNYMPLLELLDVSDLRTDLPSIDPLLQPDCPITHDTLRSLVVGRCFTTDNFRYIHLPALRHLEVKRAPWPSDKDMFFIRKNTFKLETLAVHSEKVTPNLLDVLKLHQETITTLHVHSPVTPAAGADALLAFIGGAPHVFPGLQSLTLAFRPNPSQLKNLIALVQARGKLLRELTLKATGNNKNTRNDKRLEAAVNLCRKAGCSVKVCSLYGDAYFTPPPT